MVEPYETRTALAILKQHAPELKQLGVVSASLFGSTARDEATIDSDIDVAVKLDDSLRGLYAFGALDRVKEELTRAIKARVDVVPEPAEPGPLKTAIDKVHCIYFDKCTCRACEKLCPSQAVDLSQTDKEREVEVACELSFQ